MQVLVVLAESLDSVVTRHTLFERCWGASDVGDDSLNRAVASIRKLGADIAESSFAVETIPRTGYRLINEALEERDSRRNRGTIEKRESFDRRGLIIGGGASLTALGGIAWWRSQVSTPDEFGALMRRGEEALAKSEEDLSTVATFEKAVELRPDNARAWGLLAITAVDVIDSSGTGKSGTGGERAREAASRALAIDPNESNALTALALLQEWIDGWAAFDRRLRDILKIDPANPRAMTALVALLQAAGLTRESYSWNQRQFALHPSSPVPIWRRAFKLWIMGRNAEAYRVIERAWEIWPRDSGVWNARFIIFAFNDRTKAALDMLEADPDMLGPAKSMEVWRASLEALQTRTPAAIERATDECLMAARTAPGLAAHGAMVLGALGQVDAAYQIANGFLLSRGQVLVQRPTSSRSGMIASRGWKWTQWLFTPPAASLRADKRFKPLCYALGLTAYWSERKVRPDYLAGG
jgi:tetratricopeptide (TPR) repeat protein